MTVTKILIDFQEYERLLNIQKNATELKKEIADLKEKLNGYEKKTKHDSPNNINKQILEDEDLLKETSGDDSDGDLGGGGDHYNPELSNFQREIKSNLDHDQSLPLPAPNQTEEEAETECPPAKSAKLVKEVHAPGNNSDDNYLSLLYPKLRKRGQHFLTKLRSNGCSFDSKSGEILNLKGVYIHEVLPFVMMNRKGPVPQNIKLFLNFLVKTGLEDDFLLNPNCTDYFDWYHV